MLITAEQARAEARSCAARAPETCAVAHIRAIGLDKILVALDAGLIEQPLFVALVLMALVTSLASGPAMARLLREQ